MKTSTTATSAGPVSARGRRAASLRGAVGVRGRIPPVTSADGANKGTATATVLSAGIEADIELVAARGRRAAALRGLVGSSGRTVREARSAA